MRPSTACSAAIAICLFGALPFASASAHGSHGSASAAAVEAPDTVIASPSPDARWLAGDHHVHSRFSVGMDTRTTPPTPVMGADAAYPIPMNAVMARRFGLSWMVSTDHGGAEHSKINHDHAYPELLQSPHELLALYVHLA